LRYYVDVPVTVFVVFALVLILRNNILSLVERITYLFLLKMKWNLCSKKNNQAAIGRSRIRDNKVVSISSIGAIGMIWTAAVVQGFTARRQLLLLHHKKVAFPPTSTQRQGPFSLFSSLLSSTSFHFDVIVVGGGHAGCDAAAAAARTGAST